MGTLYLTARALGNAHYNDDYGPWIVADPVCYYAFLNITFSRLLHYFSVNYLPAASLLCVASLCVASFKKVEGMGEYGCDC